MDRPGAARGKGRGSGVRETDPDPRERGPLGVHTAIQWSGGRFDGDQLDDRKLAMVEPACVSRANCPQR